MEAGTPGKSQRSGVTPDTAPRESRTLGGRDVWWRAARSKAKAISLLCPLRPLIRTWQRPGLRPCFREYCKTGGFDAAGFPPA